MVQTLAIERNLKTLRQLQNEFALSRTEKDEFFPEWYRDLAKLTTNEINCLDEIKEQYLYQLSQGRLGEETIKLIVLSPLLKLAGFYDPPFQFRAEETIQLTIESQEIIYRGKIDALVLQDRLWIVVIESKETSFSLELAIPQTLAYMLANPQPDRAVFGMITNEGNFIFLKLEHQPSPQYEISDLYSLLPRQNRLYPVLQILKGFGDRMKTN
ncbi:MULTISPECIES: restriction endonuclease subunit R [Spirulina sp. CCY15215]|uniref:restriction endonuclease subunit R n=1 Tax=Spirulina sp. CCY15215 TaxID=2767591 RepID=UPI001950CFA8|nr:restriction endonuclease subunit R [Spirulina major]